jgi:type I restriction enzyme, S subunit
VSVPKLRFPEFQDTLEWEEKKLEQISDIRTGPFGSVLHESDYVETGTPIITVEHLDDLGIKGNNFPRVSEGDKTRLKSYQLKQGDIVFSRVGSVDRSSIIRAHEEGWLFSGRLLRLRIKKIEENSPQFLNQLLKHEPNKVKIRDRAVGQTMPSLNTEILNGISFYFPSAPEQQKIADCLSSLESVISAQSQRLEALKQHKQGLMQRLFPAEGETVPRLRFLEFQGTGEWEEQRLGSVSEIVRGGSPRPIEDFLTNDADGLHWLKIGDVASDSKYITETRERVVKAALSKTRVVRPGDLILSNSMSFGRPYISKIETCIHDGWIAVTRISSNVITDYLYYLISSDGCQSYFSNNAAGAVVQNLNADIIKSLPTLIPSLLEQQKIADCLTSLDSLITAQTQKLEALTTFKKGLMQQLFPAPLEGQA